METMVMVIQLVIAFGLLNVWLLRSGRPTPYRGGSAANMREEFEIYGLPTWFMGAIGFLKVSLALALFAGIWFPELTRYSAMGIATLMAGAVAMHVKVRDPLMKSVPAFSLLILSAFVGLA
jgi:hypothetical protein